MPYNLQTVQHWREQTFAQSPVVSATVSSGQAVLGAGAGVLLVPRLPAAIFAALVTPLCIREHTRSFSSKEKRRSGLSGSLVAVSLARGINIHNIS